MHHGVTDVFRREVVPDEELVRELKRVSRLQRKGEAAGSGTGDPGLVAKLVNRPWPADDEVLAAVRAAR